MTQDTNSLIEQQLSWRYATKRFDPTKKIAAKDWHTLEESLRLAPSSFGLQPWKFIVVKNPEVRKQLQPLSWNQPQLVEASHLVVIAAKKEVSHADVERFLASISETRGVPVAALQDYGGMMKGFLDALAQQGTCEHWSTRQAYLALGMLLSTAAVLKIDACPLEGINPVAYDEVLGLNQSGYSTKVACALGYRSAEDAAAFYTKVRYDRAQVILDV
ncbi:MAG: putative nitroreductase YfkO [Pseudomonadota bacterium]|jgi:nitroreductase